MTVRGFLCGPRLYEYDGWFFENHSYCGPWPLKKNGDPRKKAGRKFYKDVQPFFDMSDKEKKKYQVGDWGGCIPF